MRAYLTAAVLARFADEGVAIALALLALDRTGSAALGAFVLTAWLAPHAVAAPLAGALAERALRPRLFYGCALAVLAVSLALLGLTVGTAPTALALTLALVGGACGPVVTGGLSSLLAGLASGPVARTRAYALDAATYNAASVTAPAAVAATAAAFTPALATGLLAAAVGGAALLAPFLPTPVPSEPVRDARRAGPPGVAEAMDGKGAYGDGPYGDGPHTDVSYGDGPYGGGRDGTRRDGTGPGAVPLRARVASGLAALWRIPQLRALTAATSVAFLGIGALPVTAVLLAVHRGEADGGGLLMTALALGALGSSVALARRPPELDPALLATLSLSVTGAALAGAALVPSFPVAVALFVLAGLGDGPLLSTTLRIRADHAPKDVHTQVFTLGAGFKQTAAAAGAALVGALSWLHPAPLLLAVAALQFAAVLLLRLLGRTGKGGSSAARAAPEP